MKILFLEDEAQDVEFMCYELSNAGLKNAHKHVSSRKDFLEMLEKFRPDVVIADYTLPMFNGMHAFRLFKEKNISIPFILVTGQLDEDLAAECLSEGVDDFVLKSNFKRLPFVIKRCLEIKSAEIEQGKIAAELHKKREELNALQKKAEKERVVELLSNREFEILCLIAKGESIKEIADKLILSPATIATYRSRLLEKLEIKSNVDLTRYAMENKLID